MTYYYDLSLLTFLGILFFVIQYFLYKHNKSIEDNEIIYITHLQLLVIQHLYKKDFIKHTNKDTKYNIVRQIVNNLLKYEIKETKLNLKDISETIINEIVQTQLKQNNINKKIILFPNKTQVKHKVDNQYQQIINQVNDELSNIDWSKISNREQIDKIDKQSDKIGNYIKQKYDFETQETKRENEVINKQIPNVEELSKNIKVDMGFLDDNKNKETKLDKNDKILDKLNEKLLKQQTTKFSPMEKSILNRVIGKDITNDNNK